jgi:hypothetical protein
MLLMFMVGTGSLGWMLALGAVMAVEKNMPWGRRISAPLGATLVGCGLILGITPVLQPPDGAAVRVALTPSDHFSVSGTATFADTSCGVEVDVGGLPDSGATYLAHVHPGSCAGEPTGGDEHHTHGHHHGSADEIEHPLTPIASDSRGNGSSTTVIEGVTVADLFPDKDLHVNVHAEASGSEVLPGNLA